MERRKFLIGAGSLAAGSAAAVGTGAFTSVEADRNFDINVSDDSAALLAIEPAGTENSDRYVQVDQSESDIATTYKVEIDEGISGNAAGVNNDAITEIDGLLRIKNQGSQEVEVTVEKGYAPGDTDGNVVEFTEDGNSITSSSGVTLSPGEDFVLDLEIDLLNNDGNNELLLEYATFHADSTA